MDKAAVLAEIDNVFARCGASADDPKVPRTPASNIGAYPRVIGNAAAMMSSIAACIERNSPHGAYLTELERARAMGTNNMTVQVDAFLGILLSVRQDIEAGYGRNLERRVEDEVFDDLLEMASHLAKPSMHPPTGVVLAVSVLEERIRGLASAHGIQVEGGKGPRSFEDLVGDLYAGDHMTKAESRLLGGWYGQRNEAAHGHFENVNDGAVPGIIDGIRAFLVKYA